MLKGREREEGREGSKREMWRGGKMLERSRASMLGCIVPFHMFHVPILYTSPCCKQHSLLSSVSHKPENKERRER